MAIIALYKMKINDTSVMEIVKYLPPRYLYVNLSKDGLKDNSFM
jgi:hypothetical protein